MKKLLVVVWFISILGNSAVASDYLGNLNSNLYDPNSISNPYGAGNPTTRIV